MISLEYLFAYGTLRQPGVQQATLGRLVETSDDALPGFRLEVLRITDPEVIGTSGSNQHPILIETASDGDVVHGAVVQISGEELRAADGYEVDGYRRISAHLMSGREAWVYVSASASGEI